MLLRMTLEVVADGTTHHHVLPVLAEVIATIDDHDDVVTLLRSYLRFMHPHWRTTIPQIVSVLRCFARGWHNERVREHLYRWCCDAPRGEDAADVFRVARWYLAYGGLVVPAYRRQLITVIREAWATGSLHDHAIVAALIDAEERSGTEMDEATMEEVVPIVQHLLTHPPHHGERRSLRLPIRFLRYGLSYARCRDAIGRMVAPMLRGATEDTIEAILSILGHDGWDQRWVAEIDGHLRAMVFGSHGWSAPLRAQAISTIARTFPPHRVQGFRADALGYLQSGAGHEPHADPVVVAMLALVGHADGASADDTVPITTESHRQVLLDAIARQLAQADSSPVLRQMLFTVMARLVRVPVYHRPVLHQLYRLVQHGPMQADDWEGVVEVFRQAIAVSPDALPDILAVLRHGCRALPQGRFYRLSWMLLRDGSMHPFVHETVIESMMTWLHTLETTSSHDSDSVLRSTGVGEVLELVLAEPVVFDRDATVRRRWMREAFGRGWESVADAVGRALHHHAMAHDVCALLRDSLDRASPWTDERVMVMRMVLRVVHTWYTDPTRPRPPHVAAMVMDTMGRALQTVDRYGIPIPSDLLITLIACMRLGMPSVHDPRPIIVAVLPYATYPDPTVRIAVIELLGDGWVAKTISDDETTYDTMMCLADDASPDVIRAVMCAVSRAWCADHPDPRLLTITTYVSRYLLCA
jgi:hypothetical protein